jgi:hypothetical protein
VSLLWGAPLALAGFAALLLPVLLHLQRRRSVQLWRFAALRWIGAQPRPRRTWRLVEWFLLAVRLLLVAALVAWLAHPWLRGAPHEDVHWIAVVPGASGVPAGDAAAHAVWLRPGFPSVTSPPPEADAAPVSSLLREFDARLAASDTLEVRVPEQLDGLDAAAIALSREVRWVVGGSAPATERAPVAKPVLALRYTDEADPALPYVRAAIRAWQSAPLLAVQLDEGLADKPLPARADAVLRLDGKPLDPARLQSAEYPRELHRSLFGDPPSPDRAFAAAVAPNATAAPTPPPAMSLRRWLAWLAAGLFLLERVLANGRRLAVTP